MEALDPNINQEDILDRIAQVHAVQSEHEQSKKDPDNTQQLRLSSTLSNSSKNKYFGFMKKLRNVEKQPEQSTNDIQLVEPAISNHDIEVQSDHNQFVVINKPNKENVQKQLNEPQIKRSYATGHSSVMNFHWPAQRKKRGRPIGSRVINGKLVVNPENFFNTRMQSTQITSKQQIGQVDYRKKSKIGFNVPTESLHTAKCITSNSTVLFDTKTNMKNANPAITLSKRTTTDQFTNFHKKIHKENSKLEFHNIDLYRYIAHSISPGSLIYTFSRNECFWPAIVTLCPITLKWIRISECGQYALIYVQYIHSERPSTWVIHTDIIKCTNGDDLKEELAKIETGLVFKEKRFIQALYRSQQLKRAFIKAYQIIKKIHCVVPYYARLRDDLFPTFDLSTGQLLEINDEEKTIDNIDIVNLI